MKRVYFGLLLTLITATLLSATGPTTLTLEQCIQIALTKSPDAAAAQALVDAARANVKFTHANYLPQISMGMSYTRQTYNYAGTAGTPPRLWRLFYTGQTSSTAPYYFGGLNLSQTILDFGRIKGQVEVSQAQFEAAVHNLRFVRDQIYYNVRSAYYTVIADQEIVRIQQAAMRDAQWHVDQAQSFHRAGTAPKITVTSEQVTLANTQLALHQAEEALEVDKGALATAMGLPVDKAPTPAETLGALRKPESLNQLLSKAEKTREDLKSQFDQVKAAMGNLLTAKGDLKPNLSLSTFLDFRNLTWPLVYNWSLGQILAQSIFMGGANHARVKAAEAQEAAAEDSVESLRLLVDQQVYDALSGLRVARDEIATAEIAHRYAQENLALAESRFKVGVGNVIELDDAEYQATQAAIQLVDTRYNYQVASAKLDFALGRGPK